MVSRIAPVAAVVGVLVLAAGLAAGPAESGQGRGLGKVSYVYGKFVDLTPGKDVYAEALCPKGTVALAGGFTAFDESKPEEDATNPDVVVSFAGINSVAAPPKFDPRRFEVGFRNTGTSTTTVGAARATCARATDAKLVLTR